MAWNYQRKSKYSNKKAFVNGIKFDSNKEAKRFQELSLLERAGVIQNLERQVKFVLIPSQYGIVNGKKKCIERDCKYIADFAYYQNGEYIVEDTKGIRTTDYIIKRKLMLYVHNVRIREI